MAHNWRCSGGNFWASADIQLWSKEIVLKELLLDLQLWTSGDQDFGAFGRSPIVDFGGLGFLSLWQFSNALSVHLAPRGSSGSWGQTFFLGREFELWSELFFVWECFSFGS